MGFALLEVLGLTRTSLLIMRKSTYGLDWSVCEAYTDGPNFTNQEEAVESEEDKTYFRATDMLYVLHSLLHWPEYAFLAYGTYKLVKAVQEWDTASRNEIGKHIIKLFWGMEKTATHTAKESRFRTAVSVVVIFVFVAASLVIPILSIVEAYDQSQLYPNCDKQSTQLKIHYFYQFLSFLAHIVSPGIRIYMAIMVLAVQAIWFHLHTYESNKVVEIPTSSEDGITSEDWRVASSEHYECVLDYELRHDKINTILRVFRAWFVIQWFIYYFQFLVDLSQVLRPWFGDGLIFDIEYAHRIIYTIYDLLAFIIPHVSGLKMNHHHETYLSKLRERQLRDARSNGTKVRYAIASMLPVEKCKGCDFVPAIPGTGIAIPLDSPGYTLGILLTIFALAGTFVDFD